MWDFLQILLDRAKNRADWVHPINKKRYNVGFIGELRADTIKYYNYCSMTMSTLDYILGMIKVKIEKHIIIYRILDHNHS